MVTTFVDNEMSEFSSPTEFTDTSTVCENWTGTDYELQVKTIGSSAAGTETSDTITTVVYKGGQVAGYSDDGGEVTSPSDAGSNTFDFVTADSAQIQASYADPYYAVIQSADPGGGGGGGGGEEPVCDQNHICQIEGSLVRSEHQNHGLRRAAMAALLHNKQEVQNLRSGTRRFRHSIGDREITIELDSATELIISHEDRSPTKSSLARLQWTRAGDKWVRTRIEVEGETIVNGVRNATQSSTIIFGVHWDPSKVK